jgi:hypothetical protein
MSKSLKTIACLKVLRGSIAITIGVSLFLFINVRKHFLGLITQYWVALPPTILSYKWCLLGWGALIKRKY